MVFFQGRFMGAVAALMLAGLTYVSGVLSYYAIIPSVYGAIITTALGGLTVAAVAQTIAG
jgi:hypothetical protein